VKNLLGQTGDELYCLADPFELGDDQDHRKLETLLDKFLATSSHRAVENLSASGIHNLARGLCKLALRETAEAERPTFAAPPSSNPILRRWP
jgi:hypothetical protein